MDQKQLGEIRSKVEGMYDAGNFPPHYHPKVNDTPIDDDWTIVCKENDYQVVMRERGRDRVFTKADNLDECLYEIFKYISEVMALEYAEAHPSETELRWEIRSRVLQETLTKIDPEWGIRFKRSTEIYFGEHPLEKDRQERDKRDKAENSDQKQVKQSQPVQNKASNSLLDIYSPIDDICGECIEHAQTILDSDIFLAGLGKFSAQTSIPQSINVITDFERADYLMNSQEMWDDPTQAESGDQFFSGVLQEASVNTISDEYSRDEVKKRRAFLSGNYDALHDYVSVKIEEAYEKNDVRNQLAQHFSNANAEGIERHLDNNYHGVIGTCVSNWIKAAYFGGKDAYPLSAYFIDSLALGGVPTGWIGPPPESGGKAKDCLQLIHFGPKE